VTRLIRYPQYVIVDPLKDAEAFRNAIDDVVGDSRGAPPRERRAMREATGGMKMVNDDPKSSSNVASLAERRPYSPRLYALLNSVLDQPETWMSTPSIQFGGRRPADLVGTEEEAKIFDILIAVDQGLF
jgi:hypothetical protein